jgi:hypothetical protein
MISARAFYRSLRSAGAIGGWRRNIDVPLALALFEKVGNPGNLHRRTCWCGMIRMRLRKAEIPRKTDVERQT